MLGAENTPDFGKYLENSKKFEKRLVFFQENIKRNQEHLGKIFINFQILYNLM